MHCRREPAERGSAVEEAAMSATVIPLLTNDKLYPLGDLLERRERSKEEEEEEAVLPVFISVVNTHEDPPNAHQAQHRTVQTTGATSA